MNKMNIKNIIKNKYFSYNRKNQIENIGVKGLSEGLEKLN